jgi:hypothetical protein
MGTATSGPASTLTASSTRSETRTTRPGTAASANTMSDGHDGRAKVTIVRAATPPGKGRSVTELARLGAGCGEGHGSSDRATVTAEKQPLLVQVVDDAGDGVGVVGEQVPKNHTARLGGPWRVSDDGADA